MSEAGEKQQKTKTTIHLIRRAKVTRLYAWLIRLAAAFLGLLVCGIVIYGITGENPIDVFGGIFLGTFGSSRRLWVTVRETVTLLVIAVGLIPAFKMRFWNLGAEGQILVGGAVTAAVMIYLGPLLQDWLLWILAFVGAMIAGAVWGFIPAYFKAKFGTNESLFTLMMNYVAMQIVTFCVVLWENPKGSNHVGVINQGTKEGWLPSILGQEYLIDVILAAAVTAFVFWYLGRTKQGYELSVVGGSTNTARYAGISVGRVIVRTVVISGAICGLAGCMIVAGASHTISTSTGGGRGFTAIIVAWMSQFNPWAMALVSGFLCFMQQGSVQIASSYGLNENASDIITGILLFFLIGCEFFVRYRLEVTKVPIEEEGENR
ncbi:MAG: ABC transporter permease [Lachnospiraceae bacterium]|nr:ABC transporter permease [Lachnospiraceae bacterium]